MLTLSLVTEKYYTNEDRQKCLLKYYLVESEGEGIYGIGVEKYEVERRDLTLVDEEIVSAVSSGKREVLRLIDKLARGLVTPFMLVEILDEYLS